MELSFGVPMPFKVGDTVCIDDDLTGMGGVQGTILSSQVVPQQNGEDIRVYKLDVPHAEVVGDSFYFSILSEMISFP